MYHNYKPYQECYCDKNQISPLYNHYPYYDPTPNCWNDNYQMYPLCYSNQNDYLYKDYGPEPFVVNIDEVTKENEAFRTALWTGKHLQLTLMSIDVGEDIGLEIHPHLDQFIRIEEGEGIVKMGSRKDSLDFQERVYDDFAFIIPAGSWHNLINTGNKPLKLYSIYAPPQHPYGTVHLTKSEAEEAENH